METFCCSAIFPCLDATEATDREGKPDDKESSERGLKSGAEREKKVLGG